GGPAGPPVGCGGAVRGGAASRREDALVDSLAQLRLDRHRSGACPWLGQRRSTPHDREVFVRQPLRVKCILTRPRPCLIMPAKRLPSDNLGAFGQASVRKRRYGRGSGAA